MDPEIISGSIIIDSNIVFTFENYVKMKNVNNVCIAFGDVNVTERCSRKK